MGLNNIRKRLALMHPENIILTTARSEFALESYDLNVIDYLLKPVSFERIMKAVGKCCGSEKIQHISPEIYGVNGTLSDESPFIYIKSERQFIKVLLDDILYIESIKNHVKIITCKETFVTLKVRH